MGLFERLVELPAGQPSSPPLDATETQALLEALKVDASSVLGVPWGTVKEKVAAYLSDDMRSGLTGGRSDSRLLGEGPIGGHQAEFEFVCADGGGLVSFGFIPARDVPCLSLILTAKFGTPVATTTMPRPGAEVLHTLWTADGFDVMAAMTPNGAAEIAFVTDRTRRRRVVGRRTSGPGVLAKRERHGEVTVVSEVGVGTIRATRLAHCAAGFKADITVACGDLMVDAKSVMGVMMLSAEHGATLTFRAEGPDGDEAVLALLSLVREDFRLTAGDQELEEDLWRRRRPLAGEEHRT